MFYYPKSFTLKSLLTSQEVFTNVAGIALHFIRENKRIIIPENLIDVGLAIRKFKYIISQNRKYATAGDNFHI